MTQACIKKVQTRKSLTLTLQRFWLRDIISFKKSGWLQKSTRIIDLKRLSILFLLTSKYFSSLRASCKVNSLWEASISWIYLNLKKRICYAIAKWFYCYLKQQRCFIPHRPGFRNHGAALSPPSVMVWEKGCCWAWSTAEGALTILFCCGGMTIGSWIEPINFS